MYDTSLTDSERAVPCSKLGRCWPQPRSQEVGRQHRGAADLRQRHALISQDQAPILGCLQLIQMSSMWVWVNTYRYSLLGDEHP